MKPQPDFELNITFQKLIKESIKQVQLGRQNRLVTDIFRAVSRPFILHIQMVFYSPLVSS